jgi:hypothetical protein
MTRPGGPPLQWQLHCEGLAVGLFAILALAGAALAAPGDTANNAAVSGSTMPPATAQPALPSVEPVLASDATTTPAAHLSNEQQRRMLLLLLMNSAGPMGPYGGLGR